MTFTEYPYNNLRKRFGALLSDQGFDLMNKYEPLPSPAYPDPLFQLHPWPFPAPPTPQLWAPSALFSQVLDLLSWAEGQR